ncbi:TolB family protein [Algoriphagus sp.]|uniref:TolB family protein n=1 Tax=Algoriphagus sp. TaxID=1872435 RepID=UPI00391CBE70
MKKFLFSLSIFIGFTLQTTLAQGGFDIWVIDTKGKGKKFKVLTETAKALTNRPEYDNQPNFINDYQLVFSAADETGNHDIIVYNFTTNKFTNLSKTEDRSEFSPTLTDCGQYVAAVVVEPDGRQRLWLYPTNYGEPELLYDDIAPVGYYDWYDNKAAMFVLGEPNKLVYARGKGDLVEIDDHIGRAVKRRPKTSQISYLSMKSPKETGDGLELLIRTHDIKSEKTGVLGFGLAGSLDFIWQDNHYLLMAQGNNVFQKKSNHSKWEFLGEIKSDTHQNISRMAYSPDLNKLVVVMQRK